MLVSYDERKKNVKGTIIDKKVWIPKKENYIHKHKHEHTHTHTHTHTISLYNTYLYFAPEHMAIIGDIKSISHPAKGTIYWVWFFLFIFFAREMISLDPFCRHLCPPCNVLLKCFRVQRKTVCEVPPPTSCILVDNACGILIVYQ